MKAHFEKVRAGASSLRAFERIDRAFPFYWHYHPEFELTLILESSGQRLVGDGIADYASGDLVLLGPNLPHSWRSGPVRRTTQKRHRAVVVQFLPDFLGDEFFKLGEMEPILHLLSRSASGLAFGHTEVGKHVARQLAELPALPPPRRVTSLLNILLDLANEKEFHTLSASGLRPMCRVKDQQKIESICRHLGDHFKQEIDFLALSRGVRMDQAALCRFFKRGTGRTMTAYVNELRIGAATQLLTDTDRGILEICFEVGFGNYSNFHGHFKRIKGYGPNTLRQQFRTDSTNQQVRKKSAPNTIVD